MIKISRTLLAGLFLCITSAYGQPVETKAQIKRDQAILAKSKGEYLRALSLYEESMSLVSPTPYILLDVAHLAICAGELEKAKQFMTRLFTLQDKDFESTPEYDKAVFFAAQLEEIQDDRTDDSISVGPLRVDVSSALLACIGKDDDSHEFEFVEEMLGGRPSDKRNIYEKNNSRDPAMIGEWRLYYDWGVIIQTDNDDVVNAIFFSRAKNGPFSRYKGWVPFVLSTPDCYSFPGHPELLVEMIALTVTGLSKNFDSFIVTAK